jgi:regulator of sigma E protease
MAPIAIIVVSAFLLTGFLKIASYITNKIRPPSSAGIFVIYEAIFRKPVNKKAETTIIAIGAIFMVVIMILVT